MPKLISCCKWKRKLIHDWKYCMYVRSHPAHIFSGQHLLEKAEIHWVSRSQPVADSGMQTVQPRAPVYSNSPWSPNTAARDDINSREKYISSSTPRHAETISFSFTPKPAPKICFDSDNSIIFVHKDDCTCLAECVSYSLFSYTCLSNYNIYHSG